jgi:hypothetical protein
LTTLHFPGGDNGCDVEGLMLIDVDGGSLQDDVIPHTHTCLHETRNLAFWTISNYSGTTLNPTVHQWCIFDKNKIKMYG